MTARRLVGSRLPNPILTSPRKEASMDLEELAKGQEELLGGVEEALKLRGLDKLVMSEPVELLKARATRIAERIDGLERSKQNYVASIESQIEQLKSEAREIESRIKQESASLKAAANASKATAAARSKAVTPANSKRAATARTKAATASKGKTAAKSPSKRGRKG
ncbi:MAG: hypothetical protein M3Q19_06400 [Pseudomonadota bacterium]|nr:hypothetical protein [Pseudomonadota bacterium]